MLKSFGITYNYAGENLAGSPTVEIAHQNLMASPDIENILILILRT